MGNKIDRVKKHFADNKGTYIACGVTAVVVGAGTFFFTRRVPSADFAQKVTQQVTQIGFRNEANPVIINLIERSTASKPVHLVGTNLYFSSLGEAARETGHQLSMISKNVNGHIPDVKGDVFELLEPAA